MPVISICICTLLLLGNVCLYGQTTSETQPLLILSDLNHSDGQSGKIQIEQPAQAKELLEKHVANNKLKKGIPGYRIRIFSQSGQTARQKATETRAAFMQAFPNIEADMIYEEPYFKIVVGNFRTRTQMYQALKRISARFPNAFPINEMIKIPD